MASWPRWVFGFRFFLGIVGFAPPARVLVVDFVKRFDRLVRSSILCLACCTSWNVFAGVSIVAISLSLSCTLLNVSLLFSSGTSILTWLLSTRLHLLPWSHFEPKCCSTTFYANHISISTSTSLITFGCLVNPMNF